MINTLKTINKILQNRIKWAIFGGVAIAIHKGHFYREYIDVDIIIEDNEKVVRALFNSQKLNIRLKNRRKRGYTRINNYEIELMFMTGDNKIDLADGEFEFKSIEIIRINDLSLPVIDLQSLYQAKLRYSESLKIDSEIKTNLKKRVHLNNTLKDIDVIEKLLNQ